MSYSVLDKITQNLMWKHRELRKDPLWLLRSFQSSLHAAQENGELTAEQTSELLSEKLPKYIQDAIGLPSYGRANASKMGSEQIRGFLNDLYKEGELLADVFGKEGIHLKSAAAAKAGAEWKHVAAAEHVAEAMKAVGELWQLDELHRSSSITAEEYGKKLGQVCERMDAGGLSGIFKMSKANPEIVKHFMEDTRRISVTHNIIIEGGVLSDISGVNSTIPDLHSMSRGDYMKKMLKHAGKLMDNKHFSDADKIAEIEELLYAVSDFPYRFELGEVIERHQARVWNFDKVAEVFIRPLGEVTEAFSATVKHYIGIAKEMDSITANGTKSPSELSFNNAERFAELEKEANTAKKAMHEAGHAVALRVGIPIGGEHDKPFLALTDKLKAQFERLGEDIAKGLEEAPKKYTGLRIAGGAASALVAANGLANLYDKEPSETPEQPEKKSLNFARVAQTALGVTGVVTSFALKNKLFGEQVSKIAR